MKPDQIEPGTFVAPNVENPWPVAPPAKPAEGVEPIKLDRDNGHRVPALNLLQKVVTEPVPAAVPVAAAAGKKKTPLVAILGIAVLGVVAAAGVYVAVARKPQPVTTVVRPSATPKASPTPTPSPSPTPSATPSPTPSPTPVAATVTAPVTAPTASNPQAVTVTSKSGLWLRSSPTSVNQSNVIGWMPNGAVVSVDSVGSFWWHGTYRGTKGYFASKYTQ
ncbi:MAG TPA: SH3 domain-containing protein [Candidatus Saccharimonadia bacterium]|nr:SH3 domain-containing protein [Candidatus Saccharimonadia bacterium]